MIHKILEAIAPFFHQHQLGFPQTQVDAKRRRIRKFGKVVITRQCVTCGASVEYTGELREAS